MSVQYCLILYRGSVESTYLEVIGLLYIRKPNPNFNNSSKKLNLISYDRVMCSRRNANVSRVNSQPLLDF